MKCSFVKFCDVDHFVEAQMRSNIEELEANIEELRRQYESIQDRFRKEESDKTVSDF